MKVSALQETNTELVLLSFHVLEIWNELILHTFFCYLPQRNLTVIYFVRSK